MQKVSLPKYLSFAAPLTDSFASLGYVEGMNISTSPSSGAVNVIVTYAGSESFVNLICPETLVRDVPVPLMLFVSNSTGLNSSTVSSSPSIAVTVAFMTSNGVSNSVSSEHTSSPAIFSSTPVTMARAYGFS